LYIELEVSWDDRPFFTDRFKINSKKQLNAHAAMRLDGKLYFYHYPDKSGVVPPS
jgi:hypothetical protein